MPKIAHKIKRQKIKRLAVTPNNWGINVPNSYRAGTANSQNPDTKLVAFAIGVILLGLVGAAAQVIFK